MKRFSSMFCALLLGFTVAFTPNLKASAATQTPITRTQAEQRALSMINLNWTYTQSTNGNIAANKAAYVTQPKQLIGITSGQMTGIPYDWGGLDGINSTSYSAPWSNFLDAVNKGAFIGNVNTSAGYGYISGTAGIDCSGFVQASFNIQDYKLSTSTIFNNYFTKIALSDLKHMDILDKPGDHVVIFDRWGTLNGVSGAFTYESTPDQTFGGIQGTKQYFISMNEINSGYIPGRYINIVEDTSTPTPAPAPQPAPVPQPTPTPVSQGLQPDMFAQVTNVNIAANFRSAPSTTAAILGTVPKNTVLYLIASSSGWYQVSYNGQVGWIWGNTLSSIPSGKYVAINGVYQLNLRDKPSMNSNIIGVLKQNQYAQVIDYSSDGNWFKLNINGTEGWAYRQYLKYIY